MPRYVAFLRAINVGGHTVKMDRLQALFERLGFDDVETFIASGNVIFRSRSMNTRALATRIEKTLAAALGYEVATFIRTDEEVAAIARRLPFDEVAHKSAVAFVVGFLSGRLAAGAAKTLASLGTEIDRFAVHGSEIYWLCRTNQSESTFSNALFEKTLRLKSTFRNMNTLVRLAAKYPCK
ncbi:MAG: DUF1697 domain-containing protein, partial [Steroidobacterales bacterium]